jgi:hypothetical protein
MGQRQIHHPITIARSSTPMTTAVNSMGTGTGTGIGRDADA